MSPSFRARHGGVSLIIVLIMLGIIGLMSAAVMRSLTSNEMVARNFRHQLLAQQQAESALRFCERQLLLPDAQRVPTLREAQLPIADTSQGWAMQPSWNGTGAAGASLTTIPSDFVLLPATGPVQTEVPPQCLVEKRPGSLGEAYRVTARGYSASYARDSAGNTSAGTVSWLQTEVLIGPADASPKAARVIKDRLWSRIVSPPFY